MSQVTGDFSVVFASAIRLLCSWALRVSTTREIVQKTVSKFLLGTLEALLRDHPLQSSLVRPRNSFGPKILISAGSLLVVLESQRLALWEQFLTTV
jgi:hypothetical protein